MSNKVVKIPPNFNWADVSPVENFIHDTVAEGVRYEIDYYLLCTDTAISHLLRQCQSGWLAFVWTSEHAVTLQIYDIDYDQDLLSYLTAYSQMTASHPDPIDIVKRPSAFLLSQKEDAIPLAGVDVAAVNRLTIHGSLQKYMLLQPIVNARRMLRDCERAIVDRMVKVMTPGMSAEHVLRVAHHALRRREWDSQLLQSIDDTILSHYKQFDLPIVKAQE